MELVGMSITVYEKQKTILEKWAREEDRSVSAVFRRLIEQEIERRQAQDIHQVNRNTATLEHPEKAL